LDTADYISNTLGEYESALFKSTSGCPRAQPEGVARYTNIEKKRVQMIELLTHHASQLREIMKKQP
jgi:hypothetical protein